MTLILDLTVFFGVVFLAHIAQRRLGEETVRRCGNRLRVSPVLLGSAFLLLVLSACSWSSTTSGTSQSSGMVNSGSWYVLVPWPHDGRPYESDRFVVYSDSASSEARGELADQAERLWTEILSDMDIESQLLNLPPGQEKVHIYAFKDRSPEWAGKAYYGGLVISSPDRPILFGLARTEAGRYESTLKHELTHVVSESLLHSGGLDEPPWVPVWFFEGFAEVMSTGTGSGAVRGMDHLNYLTSKYGHLNPVSYESDANVEGGPDAYTEYHYPMRQLAVEYLLADNGYERTPAEAAALLIDMAGGTQYDTAFADHMGITVTDYENQFFELMSGYLPERSGPIVFAPAGLLLILMITIGLASLLSVRSLRASSHAATLEGSIENSQPARLGQIGFFAWVSTVVALSLGLYLIGVYSIGGSFALTSAEKGVGLVILVGYLSVSAFLFTWAIRLRRSQSPIAWLCPLIAIGAAAVTTGIIIVLVPVL